MDRGPEVSSFIRRRLALKLEMSSFGRKGNVFRQIKRLSQRKAKSQGGPFLVWDVGAHNGSWSESARWVLARGSKVFAFEANIAHQNELVRKRIDHKIALLGSQDGEIVEFFASENGGTGDSVFRESSAHYSDASPQRLEVRTLSALAQEGNLGCPDFIKLDTQGSELEVLKGYKDQLGGVSWLYLELPISDYNIGAPTLAEVVGWLKDYDFVPRELLEIHKIEGVVVQVDMLFENLNR